MHVGLGVVFRLLALLGDTQLQLHAALLAAIVVDRDVARGLMEVGAGLLDIGLVGFQYLDVRVVGEILGAMTISQAARPSADEFFIVLEEAGSALRHLEWEGPGTESRE
ncbi:hypothetical protein D3C78_1257700 [compost metagenome]